MGQLHSFLRWLYINSSRILDTHYLDCHLVVLIIHNNYEAGLHSQLKKFDIPLRDDCDSLDPNNLWDPFYDDFD